MSRRRVIRCAACSRRIKDHHAHVGVEDYQTGREIAYHARPECQRIGVEQMTRMMERGRLYVAHHYHVCGDEAPGFDCSGGCFSDGLVIGRS